MNEHARCLELAIARLDFALSPDDEALISAHLASCSVCRAEARAIRADSRRLIGTALDLPAPRGVRESVLTAALENQAASPVIGRPLLALALVALLVMLAGATVFLGARLVQLIEDSRRPVPIVSASPTPWPSPTSGPMAPVVRSGTDAIGDAGEGPDIVSIETTATQNWVVLTLELARPPESSWGIVVRLRNGRNLEEGEPGPVPCAPWAEDAVIGITAPGARLEGGNPELVDAGLLGTAVPLTIDGNALSLTLPYALLDVSDSLYLALWATDSSGGEDYYPDEVEGSQECFAALRPGDVSVTSPAMPDLVGDGTVDILAVTTSLANENLDIAFEFSGDYRRDESVLEIDIADPAQVVQQSCFWNREYRIRLSREEDPALMVADADPSEGTPLSFWISGSRVGIEVPLSLIGSPPSVYFTASAYRAGPTPGTVDHFPNWVTEQWRTRPCRRVVVGQASPPASASPSPSPLSAATTSGSDPWATALFVTLLAAVAAVLVFAWVGHRGPAGRAVASRRPGAAHKPPGDLTAAIEELREVREETP